jgi:hypothetical protein
MRITRPAISKRRGVMHGACQSEGICFRGVVQNGGRKSCVYVSTRRENCADPTEAGKPSPGRHWSALAFIGGLDGGEGPWHMACTHSCPRGYRGGSAATCGLAMRYSILLIAFLSFTALGCAPRAQTVTLDIPVHHPVSVAPAELEPGSSKVTAIDVPFGGGAYRYKDKDLAVLQQMLDETNPMPAAVGESFRVHVLIRRFLVSYHQSEAVGIACIAWALTNPRDELIFNETFYAAKYTGNKGVNGVKKPIHKGITKRVHTATQSVASGLPPGPPPTSVYEDYESAAAAIPDELGRILVINFGRGGVTRGVEYQGETGEEFARCGDEIDWYYRLGIPRPAEEPSSTTPLPPEGEPSP